MKQFKYEFMIIGNDNGLKVGMRSVCGRKIVRLVPWAEVTDAKLDVIETSLEIMEYQIDCDIERSVGG